MNMRDIEIIVTKWLRKNWNTGKCDKLKNMKLFMKKYS